MFKLKNANITNKILDILSSETEGDNLELSFDEIVEYKKLINIRKKNLNDFISVIGSNDEELYKLALINDVEVHNLVEKYPKMDEQEFNALAYSIKHNWQIEPVLVYRGKIVDGRHRYYALKKLKIPIIKIQILQNNLTLKEVEDIIDAKNSQRRSMTKSQKAIVAYREWKENSDATKGDVALKHGIAQANLSYAERIEKKLGSDVLDFMLKNGFWMNNGKKYRSLTSIVSYIRKIEEDNKKTYELSVDIKDDVTKDIIDKLKIMKQNGSIEKIAIIFKYAKRYIRELEE